MTVIAYNSTDSSAPTLNGTVDSLNALLKACLVDGYGSKSAAGWTRAFYDTTTKTAVFKSNASPFAWLQVQDNAQAGGGAREARIRGYEDMTAFDTGTGPYPTVAQRTNGYTVRKSATADSTARVWTLVADEHRLYLFIDNGDVSSHSQMTEFGRFKSYKSGDNYGNQITGRLVENNSSYTSGNELAPVRHPTLAVSTGARYIPRSYTGTGSSIQAGAHGDNAKANTTADYVAGGVGQTYPHPVDGGVQLSKTFIHEANVVRGEVPGIWFPLHNRPFSHRDTLSGVDALTGRSFLVLNVCGTSGQILVETSNTWDT